ncbi:MAG: hypothetical protein ACLFV4_03695, partial [Candidatus Hydrogenedentota bacterium]
MSIKEIWPNGVAALAALITAVALVGCPPELEPDSGGEAKVHMLLTAEQHEKFASQVVGSLEVPEKQGAIEVEEIASLEVTVTSISFDGPADQDEGQEEEKEDGEVVVFEGERDVELM